MTTKRTPASRAEQVVRARVDEFYRAREERIARSKRAIVGASEAAQNYFDARAALYDAVESVGNDATHSDLARMIGLTEAQLTQVIRQEREMRRQEKAAEQEEGSAADDGQQPDQDSPDKGDQGGDASPQPAPVPDGGTPQEGAPSFGV